MCAEGTGDKWSVKKVRMRWKGRGKEGGRRDSVGRRRIWIFSLEEEEEGEKGPSRENRKKMKGKRKEEERKGMFRVRQSV